MDDNSVTALTTHLQDVLVLSVIIQIAIILELDLYSPIALTGLLLKPAAAVK